MKNKTNWVFEYLKWFKIRILWRLVYKNMKITVTGSFGSSDLQYILRNKKSVLYAIVKKIRNETERPWRFA